MRRQLRQGKENALVCYREVYILDLADLDSLVLAEPTSLALCIYSGPREAPAATKPEYFVIRLVKASSLNGRPLNQAIY